MERSLVAFDQNFSGAIGDFPALLQRKGLLAPAVANPVPQAGTPQKMWQPTEATTILAFKFSGGVLVAGDRRATAGNTVVYDRADKVWKSIGTRSWQLPACQRQRGKWRACSNTRSSTFAGLNC